MNHYLFFLIAGLIVIIFSSCLLRKHVIIGFIGYAIGLFIVTTGPFLASHFSTYVRDVESYKVLGVTADVDNGKYGISYVMDDGTVRLQKTEDVFIAQDGDERFAKCLYSLGFLKITKYVYFTDEDTFSEMLKK